MPTINGTNGNDNGTGLPVLNGTAEDDTIRGFAGDDILNGNGGNDFLFGDEGVDVLDGGIGNDFLDGGIGDDTLSDSSGSNTFSGGEGNDLIIANSASAGQSINSGDGNDEIRLSSGNGNTVNGGSGNDRIILGSTTGNILTGGAGSDIFTFQADTLGNTITDFTVGPAGDVIRIATSQLTNYSGGNPFASGHLRVVQNGNDTLVQIDLDGSGSGASFVTQVVLQNVAASTLSASNFDGFAPFPATDVRNDFNGDGRSDILWRNVDGTTTNWLGASNGSFTDNSAVFARAVPTAWTIAGTGDFNGDGRDDILWRNSDGTTTNWLGTVDGGFTDNSAVFARSVPSAWTIAGTGDFNGDGRDDILWRNADGTTTNWLGAANGAFTDNSAVFARSVPTAWSIAGTGDFNGDGRDDILWRNSDGTTTNWLGTVDGGFTDNASVFARSVPTAWSIAAIGDYNGDGRDDILWRNSDGTTTNWLGAANGAFTDNSAVFARSVPTAWHVEPEPPLV